MPQCYEKILRFFLQKYEQKKISIFFFFLWGATIAIFSLNDLYILQNNIRVSKRLEE